MMLTALKNNLASFARYIWGYMGTLAMLSLMVGVLGMGIYHLYVKDAGEEYRAAKQARYYAGVYNSAGAEPPRGVCPLACPGGEACLHFEYDESGLLSKMVCVGRDGAVCAMPGSRVAQQVVEYDAQGRVAAKRNLDASGKPAADAHGVAAREFGYDAQGLQTSVVCLGPDGRKTVPRMPGYAEKTVEYDSRKRPLRVLYRDGTGHAITNAAGENSVNYHYDDAQHTVTRSNYENGVLTDNARGVAVEKTHTTADGSVSHTERIAADGSAAAGAVPMVLAEYSPSTRTKRVRFCHAGGAPIRYTRTCAEHLLRTDAVGRPEWELFQGADGLPCTEPSRGVAEHVWEYNDAGELSHEYFWDATGKPAACYEKRYFTRGDQRYSLSLHADGSTEWRPAE